MRDTQALTFLQRWGGMAGGLISTQKPCEYVNLSEILESSVSERFYLSPKACAGILRRAAMRGKELPPHLRAALEAVAGLGRTSIAMADSTSPPSRPSVER